MPDELDARRQGTVEALLDTWREAERRWEQSEPGDRSAELAVVEAYMEYHELAGTFGDDLVVVADPEGRYVSASGRVADLLGYEVVELVGMSIADVSGPVDIETWGPMFQRFLVDGHQSGRYQLRHREGHLIEVRYRARAHSPLPGYHTSRMRPDVDR